MKNTTKSEYFMVMSAKLREILVNLDADPNMHNGVNVRCACFDLRKCRKSSGKTQMAMKNVESSRGKVLIDLP